MTGIVTPPPFSKTSSGSHLLESASITRLVRRAGLFILLLACSEAVFLLGPNYYKFLSTNGNSIYIGSLTAAFLVTVLIFKANRRLSKYWQIAFAFFIATAVILLSVLFGKYLHQFIALFGASAATNPGMALGKLYDTLLVVIDWIHYI
jgi:hypothetical protein